MKIDSLLDGGLTSLGYSVLSVGVPVFSALARLLPRHISYPPRAVMS